MNATSCVYTSEDSFGYPSWPPIWLRQGLMFAAGNPRLAQGLPGLLLLPSLHKSTGTTDAHYHVQLDVSSEHLNSGLPLCIPSLLPTEPYPTWVHFKDKQHVFGSSSWEGYSIETFEDIPVINYFRWIYPSFISDTLIQRCNRGCTGQNRTQLYKLF